MTTSTPAAPAEARNSAPAKYRLLLTQVLAGIGVALAPAVFFSPRLALQSFALNYVGIWVAATVAVVALILSWAVAPVAMKRKLKAFGFLAGGLVLTLVVYFLLVDKFGVFGPFLLVGPGGLALALAGWFVLRERPGRSFAFLPIALIAAIAMFVGVMGSTGVHIAGGWVVLVIVPAVTAWLGFVVSRGDGGAEKRAASARDAELLRMEAGAQAIREWQGAYELANPGMPIPVMPPGYAPPATVAADPNHLNTLAVLSLVFGILGGYLAIVFGFLAKSQIKRTGERGNGMATAGVVLGFVWIGLTIVLLIVVGVAALMFRG